MPLPFIISKSLSFKFSIALLFSIEVSVIVFDISRDEFLIVSVSGSYSFLYSHESFVYLICLVILIHLLGCLTRLIRLNFPKLLCF